MVKDQLRWGLSPLVTVQLIADLLNPERRAVLLRGAYAEKLERKKREETVTGQLELAQEEAEALNREWDSRAETLKRAADDMEQFIRDVNGR